MLGNNHTALETIPEKYENEDPGVFLTELKGMIQNKVRSDSADNQSKLSPKSGISDESESILNGRNEKSSSNDSSRTESDLSQYYYPPLAIALSVLCTGSVLICIFMMYIVYCYSTLWLPFLLYAGWAYLIDIKTPFRGGSYRCERLRKSNIWKYVASYFPAELINDSDGEITNDRNYIFVQSPHGFYGYGAFFNLVTNATGFRQKFPGIYTRSSTLAFNFYFPFWREIHNFYGLISVDYNSCKHWLTESVNILSCKDTKGFNGRRHNLNADENGNSYEDRKKYTGKGLIIVIGGAEESKLLHPHTMDLVLHKRKGFVKLALETGSSLVPVITFGENNLYSQVPNPPGSKIRKFQDTVQRYFGFTVPLVHGRFLWLLPYRHPLVTVVGKPIHLEKMDHPDKETILKYHTIYEERLLQLYNKWKDVHDKDREREMRIVA